MMPRLLPILLLMAVFSYAEKFTVSFLPVVSYKAESGHRYRIWCRYKMSGEWTLSSDKIEDAPILVERIYLNSATNRTMFFWVQKDDEPWPNELVYGPPEKPMEEFSMLDYGIQSPPLPGE